MKFTIQIPCVITVFDATNETAADVAQAVNEISHEISSAGAGGVWSIKLHGKTTKSQVSKALKK